MKGHGEKLTRKQEAAVAALVACKTIAEAARQAGIGEVTLWRWLQLPDFQAAFRAARRRVVESAIGALQQAAVEAVDTLKRNLSCGVPTVEVSAAKAILEQSCRAVEFIDLAERVENLERATA